MTLAVSLDLEKIFDIVWRKGIFNHIELSEIPGYRNWTTGSELGDNMSHAEKRFTWEVNESRASTRRSGAGSCNLLHGTASLQVECRAHDLRRQKLMAYHALRSIANNNEERSYFLVDAKKIKTQAMLHLMMKKSSWRRQKQLKRSFRNKERLDEITLWRLKLPKFDNRTFPSVTVIP